MKNRQNPRTKSILIFTFSLLLFRVAFGDAADNIQLRKYPSQDAIVLGTVSGDYEIKIIEEYGPWYYIVVEGTTYGGGWVYANDLKPELIRRRETSTLPELVDASPEKAPGKTKQGVRSEKPSSKIQGSIKIEKNIAPPSHGKVSMSTVKIHSSTHPGSPKKNPGAAIISNKVIPDKKKQEKSSAQAENIPAKRNLQSVQTSIDPLLERKEQQIHEQAIATSFKEGKLDRPHTAAPSVTALRESRDKKDPVYKGGFRALLDFGFKLLSVALSCLAIIFSYKAKKMATLSYQVAIQFQRDFEIRQERESDRRY